MDRPVVGMVGAGQLARMTHPAAVALGVSLKVLAGRPDDSAALVTPDVTVGDHRSLADLRAFAAGCDVLTFDHEHVPTSHVEALAATGLAVRPGAGALRFAQDKLAMRERLTADGMPVPRWCAATAGPDLAGTLAGFAGPHGWPLVLKTARGGYDGRGVWHLDGPGAAPDLPGGTPVLVEQAVSIERELAAVVARSASGATAGYPVVETLQRDGICVQVTAPAPDLPAADAAEAERIAVHLAHGLGVVGILAVELFRTADGLLVNELAMRPHNSAHWSIDGAVTSQFEQHLRAVLDWPLGDPSTTAAWTVMVNLLGAPGTDLVGSLPEALADPSVRVHLYGKAPRPGRKLGHVTVCSGDPADAAARANRAAGTLVRARSAASR